MEIRKVNLPYILLAIAYIVYYFTHISEIYIVIGLIYLFIAFKGD